MDRNSYDGICAFMGGVWGRELSNVQRAAGWKMLASLPASAVEKAISVIADDGREHMPPWPLVAKAARSIADADRDQLLALPAGDTLSDQEHAAAMIRLRARQTPEQRRRADRATSETKGLPMRVRLRIAQVLLADNARLERSLWDRLMDETLAREFQLAEPLLPRVQDIHA